ncbi:MAG TPA: two-component system response regulator [Coxiellaceae bacterium]|nr:two-component system response regulator [Coxiellaceae bacterium]
MDNKNTKKTILVIEDNLLNMKLAGDLLEAANSFKVIKAYDGKSAFEILQQTIPDLIVLDLQLPDIDGFEILKKIKSDERTKAVKVVIMTALVMKEDEERIAASGCDAYIPKPINTREFVKIINAILR